MGRDTLKLLILAGIVGFAVLYGMELSSSGIHNVYGPMESPVMRQDPAAGGDDWTLPVRSTERSGTRLPAVNETDPYNWDTQGQTVIPRHDRKPIVDRISAKTGQALHGLSSGGIRFVVSLFDKVTGS
jgi:hypothetical protein